MKINDLIKDVSLINKCDLVKYEIKEKVFILTLVIKLDEEEIIEKKEDHINGRLVKVFFNDVTNVNVEGKESDNYTLVESKYDNNKIYLKYLGSNYIGKNSFVSFSFNYVNYSIEDFGLIQSPEI